MMMGQTIRAPRERLDIKAFWAEGERRGSDDEEGDCWVGVDVDIFGG